MATTATQASDAMLEKVDILRKRFPISYREAYQVLEENQGSVVKALIELEETQTNNKRFSDFLNMSMSDAGEAILENGRSVLGKVEERITVMGKDLADKIQEIVRTGQTSKIRVMRDGQTVMTIPTAVGAIGALFFPYMAVIATVVAMTAKYELVLDKRGSVRAANAPQEQKATPGVTNVHEQQKEQACVTAAADHYDADRN